MFACFCSAAVQIPRERRCECDSELLLLLFSLAYAVLDMLWGYLVEAALYDPIQIRLNIS